MITLRDCDNSSELAATPEAIRGAFVQHQEELRWLASFLTGDDEVAEACLVDACVLAQASCETQAYSVAVTPILSIIGSALEVQQARVANLARFYEGRPCDHGVHTPLTQSALEFIVRESDVLRRRLDSLCRLVLIVCGFQKCTWSEAARWMGISAASAEAAYCSALDLLEVVDCEVSLEYGAGIAAWS